MAFAIKDSLGFTGTGTSTSVHMNNVANGDTLFLCIAVNSTSTNRVAITDSAANTYTRAGSFAGTLIEVECFYVFNAVVNNTTTCTITPTVGTDIWAASWFSVSGFGTNTLVTAFDKKAGASGLGTALDSTATATTAYAHEFVLGVNGQANNRSWTAGTGYTQIGSQGNGTSAGIQTQWKEVSATGTYNETASLDVTSNWVAGVFTFTDTAAAATSGIMRLMGVGS